MAKNEEILRNLIIQNPELEVVVFVAEDATNPDYGYTMAEFGRSFVDEIATNPFDEEYMMTKEDGLEDFIDRYLDQEGHEQATDDEAEKAYNALPWRKVIVLYVNAY